MALRKSALADLGLVMQEEGVWNFSRNRWLDVVSNQCRRYAENATPSQRVEAETLTAEDVHAAVKDSGLLRYSESKAWVEFAHHTYQEFFAALAQRDINYNLDQHLRTAETRRRWQGTLVLLYGIAKDKAALYSKILGPENDYARIWLAAQCLTNSGEEIATSLQRLERTLPMN